jgi:ribosomal protein S27E
MSGCQTAGQVVSSKPLVTCPDCNDEVVTSSIKGLNFTRVVCPTCQVVRILPEGAYWHSQMVYYCPRCESLVPMNRDYRTPSEPQVATLNELLY